MSKNQNDLFEWKSKAQRELNEPSDPKLAIAELRALVEGDILLESRLDDTFMLKFLRAKKYQVNKALKLIKNYYEAKQKNPTLFILTGPSNYKNVLNSGAAFMLPDRNPNGCKIYAFRLEKIPPEITIEDVFKINLMSLEVASEESETQIAGLIVIADLAGFEWHKHYQYLSPYYAKKSAEVVQVHFHGKNINSLHKHLSPNILPKYLKGTLEFDPTAWVQHFLSKEHYFEDIDH